MSYLLNHIDNNRSEDDEDDQSKIDLLFPKCKPRTSLLSLSPSLQHMSHDSISSTSASDFCLNSLNYSTSPNDNQSNNCNLSHLDPNTCHNQHSLRRHSANSNQVKDSINNSHNNLWNSEEYRIFSSDAQEFHYENNNIDNYLWANSSETLNHCASNFPSDRNQHSSLTNNKLKKCDSNQKHSAKSHKCDNSRTVSGCRSNLYFSKAAIKLEQEIKENKNQVADANPPSVISHRPQENVKKATSNTKSVPSFSASQRKMEHNSMEDNFDNGIGSRSSGESTHSNTSDFMENLMSPVASLRGRVASGNHSGIKGHPPPPPPPNPTVLAPTLGTLRDSRIEIAGGREIFSQNRIRASRRHRGSLHTMLSNEIMQDTVPTCNISSSKMRKKSLHSHTPYQHQLHHCCHTTSPCCGPTNDCSEVALPHGSLVWEPNHSCSRATAEVISSRQQYLSHSHSFGGTGQCVKCSGACGCCGHHGFDYSSKTVGAEFDGGSRLCRNLPKLHNSSPTSPMTIRETVFAAEVRSIEKSAPRGVQVAEKSNALHCELESPCRIEPVIYEAVVGDGKVVFDDIGEWRERHGDNGGYEGGDEHDMSESQGAIKRQMQPIMSSNSKDKEETLTATSNIQRSKRPAGFDLNNTEPTTESSPGCASNRDGNTTPSGYESDECSASVCTNTSILSVTNLKTSPNFGNKRLIGNIPIAEYERSPKRFGLKQTGHPVTTHFDLIDVDIGVEMSRESDAVVNDPNAQTLIAAATSSSSSSLDNTNTNVSSNSSSRTNNRTSPRALSPTQPISAFSSRFPGFPQRVNANSTPSKENSTRASQQPCPLLDYNTKARNNLVGSSHDNLELLNDATNTDIRGSDKGDFEAVSTTATVPTTSEHLVGIASPLPRYQNGPLNPTTSSDLSGMQCNLMEANFLMDAAGEARISTTNSCNQDFLYEFSETRKVLEEFFNVAAGNPARAADKASFDELNYMLKRQTGNSYVAQRLASDVVGNLVTEESPKKPPRRGVLLLDDGDGSDEKGSPKLISFQEISVPQQLHSPQPQHKTSQLPTQSLTIAAPSARSPRSLKTHSRSQSQSPPPHDPTRDINDNLYQNDIDAETASTNTETELGETEVGLQQVGRGRNFLSPETTDCDSNELESELSLDYEASLCRAGVTRPVLDEGLSSGNESENEEIIEVDVACRDDDCYLMGSKIKHSAVAKKQNDISTDVKLFACDENKENILRNPENGTNSILTWSNVDELIQNIQVESTKAPYNNTSEPNPTLMLMKKQISEIEKEIQLRATQQSQRVQSGILVDTEIDMNSSNEIPDTSPTNSCISMSNRLNGKHVMNESKNPFSVSDTDVVHDPDCSPPNHDAEFDVLDPMRSTPPPSPAPGTFVQRQQQNYYPHTGNMRMSNSETVKNVANFNHQPTSHSIKSTNMDSLTENRSDPICVGAASSSSFGGMHASSPPSASVAAAIQDIKEAIQRAKPLSQPRHTSVSTSTSIVGSSAPCSTNSHTRSELLESESHHSPESQERVPLICDSSPVWVPRHPRSSRNRDSRSDGAKDQLLKKQRYEDIPDEDTDQETDRLLGEYLGQTRTEDDCGFYDEKDWKQKPKSRSLLPSLNKGVAFVKSATSSQAPLLSTSSSIAGGNAGPSISASNPSFNTTTINNFSNANNVSSTASATNSSSQQLIRSLSPSTSFDESQLPSSAASTAASKSKKDVKKKRSKEDLLKNPSVLIEGVLFRARYLGSTQLTCEGQPTKATRMTQAEEAVSRIKAENSVNGTNDLQQDPKIEGTAGPGVSSPSCHYASPNRGNASKVTDFDKSAVCALNMRENEEENELDEYFYGGGEDVESGCDGESDVDVELFVKSHPSMGSLQDNKGMKLPLEDIHGSANALQVHDNHALPLSLHHNRQSSGNGETCSSGVTQPPFLNLSPPCGTALPGTMFRLRFIGSMEVDEEIGSGKRRRKRPKKQMVEEAVLKMKAPEGETQPSTEVDLFISTEKIMVLNTDLKEIMMDHALRTISYIADIGDLVVLMARRRPVPTDPIDESKPARLPKMICHVFESDEAQYIAQSIGQAFQVAYMEFLKANGIEDSSFVREMDYQEVLNSQEIFGDELQMFAKKELQKEVVVPKSKGEILGVVIVESGWGSMLPTVVIANLAPAGAAARCGQLNIGDQIIAINGVSLVGLPLSTCQNYIKNTKTLNVVKLTVVPCPPVVEVKIKRPDTKYQLGFSVQNGVICSLLRGGIAERGGVRVGHRIIEINSQSVVAVPHEKIVNLLATSVGEINMKTMPTSMFRLLTGQETPLYI